MSYGLQMLELHDGWQMRAEDWAEMIPAQVPGDLYSDLLRAGKMEDPYFRDNELAALKLAEKEYEYRLDFRVPEEMLVKEQILLRFEGIDTLADVYLNGTHLGAVDNMHRIWEFPVQGLLRGKDADEVNTESRMDCSGLRGDIAAEENDAAQAKGQNTLRVVFHSPTAFIRQKYEEQVLDGTEDAMRGFPYLRKAHCMFGWDWGPRLPGGGMFRPVRLVAFDTARLEAVYIRQEHEDRAEGSAVYRAAEDESDGCGRSVPEGSAQAGTEGREVYICAETVISPAGPDCGGPENPLSARVTVLDPEGKPAAEGMAGERIRIPHAQLWYPAGYGRQPLYTVRVELLAEPSGGAADHPEDLATDSISVELLAGPSESSAVDHCEAPAADAASAGPGPGPEVLDVWERRIGLRSMGICRKKDEYGESFAHCVNGIEIFAMGGDYIPEDSLIARTSPERTRRLLQDAVRAHFNCIRVWGGGYYPEDWFYDICDELGLIVWQDFMFACAVYDLTEEFEANIAAELTDNVRRIRHHACLGLWCGNNEMEQFVAEGNWVNRPKEKSDYVKMYEYIFPKLLKKLDPQTFYWPASPSSGGDFDEPNSPDRGDTHYWDVWHGGKPFTEYRKFHFRYLSEFGFQSFPALKTVESFTLPEDRNIYSYVMEKHQRNASANGKIAGYMAQTFLYPTRFDTLIYASQLLQAQAIRYGVEHFRRWRGRCMGTVIWQLNDCWPVASWASIDYYGRWKALHYYAKRFFAPVLLSCEEEGILTQNTNPNAEPYEVRRSIRFNVCNETLEAKRVVVHWQLADSRGCVRREERQEVTVPPLQAVWLEKVDLPEADLYEDHVFYWLEDAADGEVPDGVGTANDEVPDGGGAANDEVPDGAGTADGEVPGGAGATNDEVPDGVGAVDCEVPDGVGTANDEVPDGGEPAGEAAGGSVLFCPPKYYHFRDPGLSLEVQGNEIVVSANAFARDVEIRNAQEDLLLSDNYFDMEPGTRRVRILRGELAGLQIRSTWDIR